MAAASQEAWPEAGRERSDAPRKTSRWNADRRARAKARAAAPKARRLAQHVCRRSASLFIFFLTRGEAGVDSEKAGTTPALFRIALSFALLIVAARAKLGRGCASENGDVMTQIGQRYSLCNKPADGVFCSENGLFVGNVALLNYVSDTGQWQPRPADDLNHDLSKRYGLPIAFDGRIDALSGIARALNRGDVIHAQIATLHLRIPDPPSLAKSKPTMTELMDLAYRPNTHGGPQEALIVSVDSSRRAALQRTPLRPRIRARGSSQCKQAPLPLRPISYFREQVHCPPRSGPACPPSQPSIRAKALEIPTLIDRNASRNGPKRYSIAAN